MRTPTLTALGLGALWLTLPGVSAGQTNSDSFLIGERGAALGGAFTAVADDGSALYYNPAGLARIRRTNLSLSANTYGYYSSTQEAAYRDDDSQVDLSRSGTLIVPNSLVYILPLGEPGGLEHTLAFGVMVPHAFKYEGSENGSLEEARADAFDRQDAYDAIDETVYLAGPAYAVRLGDFSVGASLLAAGYVYNARSMVTTTYGDEIGVFREQEFLAESATYLGLTGALGVHWRPLDAWSLGLKVGLPTARLWSSARVSAHRTVAEVATTDEDGDPLAQPRTVQLFQDVYRDVGGTVNWKRPLSFSLGTAWHGPDGWLVSADARLYLAQDAYARIEGKSRTAAAAPGEIWDPEEGEDRVFEAGTETLARAMVINGALGVAAPVSPTLRIMGGVWTDFSSVRDEDVFAQYGEQVDQYGLSLAVQRVKDTTLTVGVMGLLGSGRTRGVDLSRDAVDYESKITAWSVSLFLAGSAPMDDPKGCDTPQGADR
ncbi:MAG: hypothetical protein KC613_06885 [Myxococcales bacterium]|nr:hypothetical protein [Myxococcales bacterium]